MTDASNSDDTTTIKDALNAVDRIEVARKKLDKEQTKISEEKVKNTETGAA